MSNTTNAKAVILKTSEELEARKKADELYVKGKRREEAGKYKEALKFYGEALRTDKTYYLVYKNIGNCFFALYNYKQAITYYNAYLKYEKNDKKILEYVEKLNAAIKTNKPILYPEFKIPYEFKSPSTTFLFSNLDLIPPLMLLGCGTQYSQTREHGAILSTPSVLTFLGICTLGSGFLLKSNTSILLTGGGIIGLAYIVDFISSPFFATENSLKFIDYIKKTPLPIKKEKLDYKDPVFASALSLVFTGAGYFYAGDLWGGLRSILITSLLTGAGCGIAFLTSKPDKPETLVNNLTLWAIPGAIIGKIIDLYTCVLYVDKVNEEYYKQLLCPNSPYRIKEAKPKKSPFLAFAISLIPVPGLGNLYAENYWTAFTTFAFAAGGAGLYFSIPDSNLIRYDQMFLKYSGAGIFAFAYLYNLLSAPGYTAIWNAVYAGEGQNLTKENTAFVPILLKDGIGLQLTYNF